MHRLLTRNSIFINARCYCNTHTHAHSHVVSCLDCFHFAETNVLWIFSYIRNQLMSFWWICQTNTAYLSMCSTNMVLKFVCLFTLSWWHTIHMSQSIPFSIVENSIKNLFPTENFLINFHFRQFYACICTPLNKRLRLYHRHFISFGLDRFIKLNYLLNLNRLDYMVVISANIHQLSAKPRL